MMKQPGRLSRSKKGQMPFAMIAVALLLVGTGYGVICANIEDSQEEAENISDSVQAMDDAIEDNLRRIQSGLGELISRISSDENGGTLLNRIDSFDSLSETWFSENYPFCDRGVTATIVDRDLDLNVESMKLSSGDVISDVTQASFLKCTGTVTLYLSSELGESQKTLDISADGTSCLPFIAESSSRFELSSAGGSSILSQLMSYQLSALAQSRIVNGYGAFSATGEKGVDHIITNDDVNEAFRNALSIIETICFRNNGENNTELIKATSIDAAEMIVLNDGYFEIDMSAIVAQVLSSLYDEIFGKWFDLVFGDSFLEIADDLADEVLKALYDIVDFCKDTPVLREIYDFATSVCSFLEDLFGSSDEDTDSAVRYIRDAMEDAGYSENEYRFIRCNPTLHYETETFYEDDKSLTFPSLDYSVELETDMFDWDGWDDYVTDYMDNTNVIAEMIKSFLNNTFSSISDSFGIYRVSANEFDGSDFLKTYENALNTAVSQGLNGEEYYVESGLKNMKITDPFYASIYLTMVDHKEEIFLDFDTDDIIDAFEENYVKQYKNYEVHFKYGHASKYLDVVSDEEIDVLKSSCSSTVSDRLELFDKVLNSITNNKSNALTELLTTAGKKAIDIDLIKDKIAKFAFGLVDDTVNNITMGTESGIQKLDGLNCYRLYDYDGNSKEEFVDIVDRYSLDITITTPIDNSSKNIHNVNPDELSYMPFTSVFTVNVNTTLEYTVSSASAVDKALGKNDSCISGMFNIDTTMDITCVSGWELAGVSYTPSTNIADYLWSKLIEMIEPMIEPVVSLFKSIKDIYNITSSALLEVQNYLNSVISAIYDTISKSIDAVEKMIEGAIVDFLTNLIEEFDIGIAKQSITLNYFGFLVTVEFFTSTYMSKNVKHILKVSIEGKIGDADCSAFIDIKQNKNKEALIRGGAGVETDDFNIDLTLDPLLKFGNKIVSASGTVRDIDFDISIPERILYDEIEFRLSDIPCLEKVLGEIHTPFGVKVDLDAGVELKFNLPIGTGLMINEFETNPKGNDAGNEWVELYNATSKTINLDGYAVVPNSNENKALALSGTISPFEHKVFYFDGQSLNNEKNKKGSGESLSLYDPDGKVVDKTPWKKDSYNDGQTWQRKTDGDSTWVFADSTEGTSNGTIINVNSIVKTFFIDTLISSAQQAFSDMGNHLTNMDEVAAFLEHMIRLYIEKIVDKISNMLVGATLFIDVELTDEAEIAHKGISFALEVTGDLVEEGLHWILSHVPIICEFVQKPSCDDPVELVCENTYFTISTYNTVGAPELLKLPANTQVKQVYRVGVNISGLTGLFGSDTGDWKVYCGMMLEDIDPKILPTGLRSTKEKSCDLWLIKMELS